MYLSTIARCIWGSWMCKSSAEERLLIRSSSPLRRKWMLHNELDPLYLSQIAKCICLKLQNVFVSNCQIYLSTIATCIWGSWMCECKRLWIRSSGLRRKWTLHNVLDPVYLFQIAKCICLQLKNVFVYNCKMYLWQLDVQIISRGKVVDSQQKLLGQ